MTVLCIHNGPLKNALGEVNEAPQLEEGQSYEVSKEWHDAYELEGIKTPAGYSGFNKKRFIPVNEQPFELTEAADEANWYWSHPLVNP